MFDCGATHSFIAAKFARTLPLAVEFLNFPLEVRTPTGEQSFCDSYIPNIEVSVPGQNLSADVILLDMIEYDVILGIVVIAKILLLQVKLTFEKDFENNSPSVLKCRIIPKNETRLSVRGSTVPGTFTRGN